MLAIAVAYSWGKAWIGVIAICCAAALAIFGLHGSSGRAYSADSTPTLFVTDGCSRAVTAYPAASNGDISPLAPAPTGLAQPQYVAVDKNGNIYATNLCTRTITIYTEGSKGNAAPIAIIGGSNTGLSSPEGIAVDSGGNIYVADLGAASLFVYPPLGSSTGSLNEAPTATISGSNTGLNAPVGIALDSSRNIYVADANGNSVLVYPPLGSSTGSLNEAPAATISGTNTSLGVPQGIALDSSRNIYVAAGNGREVFVYSAGSNGNASPIATINGTETDLVNPVGIALDSSDQIYVVDSGTKSVFVYPPLGSNTGSLNEAPAATISGTNTGLFLPQGIALDTGRNIYVADGGNSSVTVYSPVGSSTGLLNEAPSASISTTMTTGLIYPEGIALDSSSNIYVADSGAADVFVYPAGSNGDTATLATISGSNTGLRDPQGIALDSSANIYVVDLLGSLFVYSPLGSSTGLLNEVPTATISGGNTGLNAPVGIALDSSRNIYVSDSGAASVFVYPPLGHSTGPLNEAPTATISGSNTGLRDPQGIALDSSRNIYVVDCGECNGNGTGTSVFVYPPLGSSTGSLNEAPTATISGRNTSLLYPIGIALDSSGDIYVVDLFGSVFVYPPLGSSTGVLDEFPSADISGPQTELGEPLFIAIQQLGAATPTPTASPTFTAATATPTPTAIATPTPTAAPVTLEIKPKALKFAKITVGTPSEPKTVTVSNPKGTKKHPGSAVLIEMISDPAVFTQTNDCPASLAPGTGCSISVTFTPSAPTNQTGVLTITDNAKGGRQTVSLSGTGK